MQISRRVCCGTGSTSEDLDERFKRGVLVASIATLECSAAETAIGTDAAGADGLCEASGARTKARVDATIEAGAKAVGARPAYTLPPKTVRNTGRLPSARYSKATPSAALQKRLVIKQAVANSLEDQRIEQCGLNDKCHCEERVSGEDAGSVLQAF